MQSRPGTGWMTVRDPKLIYFSISKKIPSGSDFKERATHGIPVDKTETDLLRDLSRCRKEKK